MLNGNGRRVFVSHTSEFEGWPSGVSLVRRAIEACNSLDFVAVDMSQWSASPQPPSIVCTEAVTSCDVFVALVGFQFGSPVAGGELQSYCQFELEVANSLGLPVLIFMLDKAKAQVPPEMVVDLEFGRLQEQHRTDLAHSGVTVRKFADGDDFSRQLAEALRLLPGGRRRLSADTGTRLMALDAADLNKVGSVRYWRLELSERQAMYERFLDLEPTYHVPDAPVAPAEVQARHERERPLDDGVLVELAEAFDIPLPPLRRPIREETRSSLQALHLPLTRAVWRSVVDDALVGRRQAAFRNVYEYLSCREHLASSQDDALADVLIVPGARKGHVFRADEAAKLARISSSLSLIVFSGGQPVYDDEVDLAFGEADALCHRFLMQAPDVVPTDRLQIDNRARTTAETAVHMRIHVQRVARQLGRPCRLVVVTSPYHMRRMIYLLQESFATMPHLVSSITGRISTASFDWGTMTKPTTSASRQRAEYGVGIYMLEMVKLYGGRCVGEF